MAGRKIWQLLCALAVGCALLSCEHRPLEDPYNVHYLRIYIDEQVRNVTYGFYDESRVKPEYLRPRVLRVVLTDPATDQVVTERYLQTYGEDERGYYVDGYIVADAGRYNMMVYNFGTERTKIRRENSFHQMQAYTQPVSESYYQYFPTMQEAIEKQQIRYCPDHLYLATGEPLIVNNNSLVDTLYNQQGNFFTAQSAVKSYYLQFRIKGFEYVTTAVSLLSGVAGSTTLSTRELDASDPVNVFFDMDYAEVEIARDGESKTAILYATFNTFGKLPDEENIYTMNFEFTRTDGTTQVESIDITDMFDDPIVKEKQWILIDKEIEITPTTGDGGGLKPGVGNWEDEWCDIEL